MKIVVPKRYIPLTPVCFPIFLAGPVLGGGDWQRHFIEHFMNFSVHKWSDSYREKVLPLIKFIVPCRWDETHPLAEHFADVYELIEIPDEYIEKSQTSWEFFYLDYIVFHGGVIVFGLFPESKEAPRTDGLPYAGDTRGEIGRWSTIASSNDFQNILIGAHPEFLGIKVISKDLQLQFGSEWLTEHFEKVHTTEMLADSLAESLDGFEILTYTM